MVQPRTFGFQVPGVTYVDRPGAYAFIINSKHEVAVVETPIGRFLPGGGIEGNENEEQALARELMEEIGFKIQSARFLLNATQFHWSAYYKTHFKKIGAFYRVEATPVAGTKPQAEHELFWLPITQAQVQLAQEFQRWACSEALQRAWI